MHGLLQHRAAAMGYEDIVQFLIQIDANINLRGTIKIAWLTYHIFP